MKIPNFTPLTNWATHLAKPKPKGPIATDVNQLNQARAQNKVAQTQQWAAQLQRDGFEAANPKTTPNPFVTKAYVQHAQQVATQLSTLKGRTDPKGNDVVDPGAVALSNRIKGDLSSLTTAEASADPTRSRYWSQRLKSDVAQGQTVVGYGDCGSGPMGPAIDKNPGPYFHQLTQNQQAQYFVTQQLTHRGALNEPIFGKIDDTLSAGGDASALIAQALPLVKKDLGVNIPAQAAPMGDFNPNLGPEPGSSPNSEYVPPKPSPKPPSYDPKNAQQAQIVAQVQKLPTLGNGATDGNAGGQVSQLQYLLKQNGWSGPASKTYDAATQAAVKQFQQQHGLTVDGVVGPQTWSAMLSADGDSYFALNPGQYH
jgi:hypothetical protein